MNKMQFHDTVLKAMNPFFLESEKRDQKIFIYKPWKYGIYKNSGHNT